MKLYLSSYRIPTPADLEELLGMPFKRCRTAIIFNSQDYKPEQERTQKLGELKSYMANIGLKADVIDLRQFNDPERLLKDINKYNLLWAAGGNTFVLRYELRRSGFEKNNQEFP